ncbi:hypothetical protein CLOM_g7642 [Closterium sp. NIES-68]|nr:hypothetical protein CLOM_g7642 [Closterium sp. NIES-68]GJP65851.1 hypothetical protein CLOP_g22760 [Closterium sp. NIES-67]
MVGRIVEIPLIPSGLSRDDTYRHIHHSLLLLQQVSEAVLQRVQQRVDAEAKLVHDISKRVASASKQVDSLLTSRAHLHIQSPASLPSAATRLTNHLIHSPSHTSGSSYDLLFPATVPLPLEAEPSRPSATRPSATTASITSTVTHTPAQRSADGSQNLPGQLLPRPPVLPPSLASADPSLGTSSSAEETSGDYIEGGGIASLSDRSVADPRGFLAAPQLAAFFAASGAAAAGVAAIPPGATVPEPASVALLGGAVLSSARAGAGGAEGVAGEGAAESALLSPPGGLLLLSDLRRAPYGACHPLDMQEASSLEDEKQAEQEGEGDDGASAASLADAVTTTAGRCLELLQQPLTPLAMSEFQFQPQLSKALSFSLPDSLPLPFGPSPADSPAFLGGPDDS